MTLSEIQPSSRARTIALTLASLNRLLQLHGDAMTPELARPLAARSEVRIASPTGTGETDSALMQPQTPSVTSRLARDKRDRKPVPHPEAAQPITAPESSAGLHDTEGSSTPTGQRWGMIRAGFRYALQLPTMLWGGLLGVEVDRFRASLICFIAQPSDPLGEAVVGIGSLGFGYDLWTLGADRMLAVGPHIELGTTFAMGNAVDARDSSSFTWQAALLGELGVRLPLSSAVRVDSSLRFGFARGLIARADDREMGTTHGLMFELLLGAAYRL